MEAATLADDLRRIRRRVHMHPELSMVEHETADFIASELASYGIPDVRRIAGTGVLGILIGEKPGPVTLLRADIDALPVVELNEAEYASQHHGVMHACGHDAHASILLNAARTLSRRVAEISGTIVFCFQPGEEGGGGNLAMLAAGALENPHVDRCFSLHVFTGLDVGKVGVRDGPFFASADEFRVKIFGRGGHGAMPDRAVDPIAAGAQCITALQTLVSREIAPKDPAVVTVGKFEAGSTFNVIPDEAMMMGTTRAFSADVRAAFPERIKRIIAGTCAAMQCRYHFEYHEQCPPTVNDPAINALSREVAINVVGAENVIEHDVVMWAEDMAFMHQQRPSSYFLIGARGGEDTAFPHHNARFDIDERALDIGHRMMVGIALM